MADLTLGFWILLAIFILFLLVIIIMSVIYSFQTPETLDALFRIKDFSVSHNGADSIDVIVHNVYSADTDNDKMSTFANVNQVVHTVMNSPTFQSDEPWESVAKDIGKQICNDYDVLGVSVEILVPSGSNVATATYSRGSVSRILKLDAVEA